MNAFNDCNPKVFIYIYLNRLNIVSIEPKSLQTFEMTNVLHNRYVVGIEEEMAEVGTAFETLNFLQEKLRKYQLNKVAVAKNPEQNRTLSSVNF